MPLVPPLTGNVGTLPLPGTAPTPKNGETVRAEDVQNAVQALLDQDATIEAYINDGVHNIGPGGVYAVTLNADNVQATGPLGVELPGGQPALTADPGHNNIVISTLVCKAWGNVSIGGGVVTKNDGTNFASASISGSNILIGFARNMANAAYSVTYGVEIGDIEVVGSGMVPQPFTNTTSGLKTASGFAIKLWNAFSQSVINPSGASGLKIAWNVWARQ